MPAGPDVHGDPKVDRVARIAEAVRRSAAAVLTTRGGGPGLSAIAARVHALADSLEVGTDTVADRMQDMDKFGRSVRYSPVLGSVNAIAPPLQLRPCRDGLEGTVRFSVAYQGANGMVQEGAAALILDVALANANIRAGMPGVTAQLTLHFYRPIPVGQELRVTSRHDSVSGRKAFSSGQLWMGTDLCASAEGLFIAVQQEVPDASVRTK